MVTLKFTWEHVVLALIICTHSYRCWVPISKSIRVGCRSSQTAASSPIIRYINTNPLVIIRGATQYKQISWRTHCLVSKLTRALNPRWVDSTSLFPKRICWTSQIAFHVQDLMSRTMMTYWKLLVYLTKEWCYIRRSGKRIYTLLTILRLPHFV
jgi:hypothetical protein